MQNRKYYPVSELKPNTVVHFYSFDSRRKKFEQINPKERMPSFGNSAIHTFEYDERRHPNPNLLKAEAGYHSTYYIDDKKNPHDCMHLDVHFSNQKSCDDFIESLSSDVYLFIKGVYVQQVWLAPWRSKEVTRYLARLVVTSREAYVSVLEKIFAFPEMKSSARRLNCTSRFDAMFPWGGVQTTEIESLRSWNEQNNQITASSNSNTANFMPAASSSTPVLESTPDYADETLIKPECSHSDEENIATKSDVMDSTLATSSSTFTPESTPEHANETLAEPELHHPDVRYISIEANTGNDHAVEARESPQLKASLSTHSFFSTSNPNVAKSLAATVESSHSPMPESTPNQLSGEPTTPENHSDLEEAIISSSRRRGSACCGCLLL